MKLPKVLKKAVRTATDNPLLLAGAGVTAWWLWKRAGGGLFTVSTNTPAQGATSPTAVARGPYRWNSPALNLKNQALLQGLGAFELRRGGGLGRLSKPRQSCFFGYCWGTGEKVIGSGTGG